MNIKDPALLSSILLRHGSTQGTSLDCFGTPEDPEDFMYFTVLEDRLHIDIHRVLVEVGSFYFRFTLQSAGPQLVVTRTLSNVEGTNKRIRAELGDDYAKDKIDVPFPTLSRDEEEWVATALETFVSDWMRPTAAP
jgi:hypothetical protein